MEKPSNWKETKIIHKIFETSSSFHVKKWTLEKFNYCFQHFFASINKILISEGTLRAGLALYEF